MTDLVLSGLRPAVAEKAALFFKDILKETPVTIHSLHLMGSALSEDFDPGRSDVNSIVVLQEMDLRFIEFLAPRGKRYRDKGIAAPLIMTPAYVEQSLDTFPIEFLNISLLHHTAYGEDVFANLTIEHPDLRLQCEREIKAKLMRLRQGYLSSMGDAEALGKGLLSTSITGAIPLFRALITLRGGVPPSANHQVIDALAACAQVDCTAFHDVLSAKGGSIAKSTAVALFERYYEATRQLSEIIERFNVHPEGSAHGA